MNRIAMVGVLINFNAVFEVCDKHIKLNWCNEEQYFTLANETFKQGTDWK